MDIKDPEWRHNGNNTSKLDRTPGQGNDSKNDFRQTTGTRYRSSGQPCSSLTDLSGPRTRKAPDRGSRRTVSSLLLFLITSCCAAFIKSDMTAPFYDFTNELALAVLTFSTGLHWRYLLNLNRFSIIHHYRLSAFLNGNTHSCSKVWGHPGNSTTMSLP